MSGAAKCWSKYDNITQNPALLFGLGNFNNSTINLIVQSFWQSDNYNTYYIIVSNQCGQLFKEYWLYKEVGLQVIEYVPTDSYSTVYV